MGSMPFGELHDRNSATGVSGHSQQRGLRGEDGAGRQSQRASALPQGNQAAGEPADKLHHPLHGVVCLS